MRLNGGANMRLLGCVLASLLSGSAFAALDNPTPSIPTPTSSTATISVLSGDNQTGTPVEFNTTPFDIAVWNAAGTEPLVGTEVTFTVESGGGLLAATKDAVVPSNTLTLQTDEDGTVQAYYRQPLGFGVQSEIKASAAGGEIVLRTTTLGFGETLDDAASGSGKDSGRGDSSLSGRKGRGGAVLFGGAGVSGAKSSKSKAKVAALSVAAGEVVLKTPDGNYSVNTDTWVISTYSGQ
ncbi:hypothetical protein [Opitutus sp. ER46]|uniref:hypothetical protein n=1 Tax=Opitutus sp. ER46 TaxID=2161864 RepID=UPI0011B23B13|nr:hypothetical protein [Opitutus sp. ER46]